MFLHELISQLMVTFFYERPFAQAEEDEHIQEVHTTQYQNDGTNFQA